MKAVEPIPFAPTWPEPDPRYLRDDLHPAPALPLEDVVASRWATWIRQAAEAKAAPPDYVFGALLSVVGSLVGNARWAVPWPGWTEPPALWVAGIGNPSMNKSPGLDAVVGPLKRVESAKRAEVQAELMQWREKNEIAQLLKSTWKEAAKAAAKEGAALPQLPAAAHPGPQPVMPRFALSDSTVEKLATILEAQPRGTLLARDELAGWLLGMSRYSGGGSDRPFWLEAYGGRSFSVERVGRDPVYVSNLTVGVLGSVQPDRLKSLLMNADDDGLLARFLPIWPNPAPLRRPNAPHDEGFLEEAIERLVSLEMATNENGQFQPGYVTFAEDASAALDTFRHKVRTWEAQAEGLLLSFIGKMPGLSVRLSLVLAMLDWTGGDTDEPKEVTSVVFRRAEHLIEAYFLPMARRAYAGAARDAGERAGRRLIAVLRETGWQQFSTREIRRMERGGLSTMQEINLGIQALEEADIVRAVPTQASAKGGRPKRLYDVNPVLCISQNKSDRGG
ncbi:DUF3987 domain-containing protein [Phaeobacter italicus]|uniref:DUF3987 domain-containing protein n=1 Tax=Phaeobacter italicus TaxID=481446 RepID=UPI001CD7E3BA|nr:DUF3987 domain-containing protein [Phaeobacter italicus]MCA0857281.1 DUF3987 domain-containing protein [Phaeobacter italicus]